MIFFFWFSLWQLWRWQDPLCKTSLRSVFRQSHCPSKPFFMDIRRNDRSSSEKSNLYIIPKGLFINFHFSKFFRGRCCRCEWLMTCFCLSRKYVTGGGGNIMFGWSLEEEYEFWEMMSKIFSFELCKKTPFPPFCYSGENISISTGVGFLNFFCLDSVSFVWSERTGSFAVH